MAPSAKSEFNRSLHLTRGIAILLVVIVHGMVNYVETSTTWDDAFSRIILNFNMPVFFFISGFFGRKFFFVDRAAGGVWTKFLWQFKRLGVVYLFYNLLALLIKLPLSAYVRRPIDLWPTIVNIACHPAQAPLLTLWFLYTLLMIQFVLLLVNAALRPNFRRPAVAIAGLVACLVITALAARLPSNSLFAINSVGSHIIYVYIGFLAGLRGEALSRWMSAHRRQVLIFGIAFFAYALWNWRHLNDWSLLVVVYGLTYTACCWALGIHLAARPSLPASFFQVLGDYSYEIYSNSSFFQMPIHILRARLAGRVAFGWWWANPVAVGVVNLTLGLSAPILLTRYVYRKSRWLRRLAMGDWEQPAQPAPVLTSERS
jgi:peptidoglycan/LPS O-acetylase OafA/YrhL